MYSLFDERMWKYKIIINALTFCICTPSVFDEMLVLDNGIHGRHNLHHKQLSLEWLARNIVHLLHCN